MNKVKMMMMSLFFILLLFFHTRQRSALNTAGIVHHPRAAPARDGGAHQAYTASTGQYAPRTDVNTQLAAVNSPLQVESSDCGTQNQRDRTMVHSRRCWHSLSDMMLQGRMFVAYGVNTLQQNLSVGATKEDNRQIVRLEVKYLMEYFIAVGVK